MDLSGQTAVVTGASRGIGFAVAETLAACGARVALWSRRRGPLREAAAKIAEGRDGRVVAQAVDVRRREEIEEAAAIVRDELGPVTLLVNNAGTAGPAGMDWEVDPEAWWRCVETSVLGSFLCARVFLPGMLERERGRIVGIASVTGTAAFPLLGATSVAKAALIRHLENLAEATAGRGVSVFALHPGTVATELLASYRSDARMAAFLDGLPPEGYAGPEVAAGAVARIASGALDALSGCFLDATSDLENLLAEPAEGSSERFRLRLAR